MIYIALIICCVIFSLSSYKYIMMLAMSKSFKVDNSLQLIACSRYGYELFKDRFKDFTDLRVYSVVSHMNSTAYKSNFYLKESVINHLPFDKIVIIFEEGEYDYLVSNFELDKIYS